MQTIKHEAVYISENILVYTKISQSQRNVKERITVTHERQQIWLSQPETETHQVLPNLKACTKLQEFQTY